MSLQALPKSLVDNPELGRWLSLERPGRVEVRSGKVELGQGIATALAQIAAEELDVAIERIDMAAADTARSPDEGLTAGSQSVEQSGSAIRLAAAQTRAALLLAASDRLGASGESLSCRDGAVLHEGISTGLDFWTLAADVDWEQRVTGTVSVKKAEHYGVVGESVPRLDLAAKLSHGGFIHDLAFEGMLHARVIRQPFRLARIEGIDEDRLRRRYPDVTLLRRNDFLALVGPDEYRLHRAQSEADTFVAWAEVPGLWQLAETSGPRNVRELSGSAERVTANRTFSARYSRGPIAHGSIGPSCALAHYQDDRLTVWTHSQGIFPLRAQIARCLALDADRVTLIHAHGAGCYGHNGADDAALDAAIVAMEFPGRPMRVQWSREDELARGPVGAAMAASIDAAIDAEGNIASWTVAVSSAPHAQRPGFGGHVNLTSAEALDPGRLPGKVDDLPEAAGGGASRNSIAIYDLPNHAVRVLLDTDSRIRTSSLRSLGAHLNVFAIESAMDELADMAGLDPLDFRLRHLSDERCRAVLAGAAEMSGWSVGQPSGEGRALGLAAARYKNKGAWLAAVAEVTVDEEIRVARLWLCVDAGLIVNPEGARNQIEGGAIQAVSWTLKEEVPVADDRIPALDWQSYPILRFSEVPEIETRFIVDPTRPPLGAGEAAQGPVAAAIGNAASRALGLRMRDLPLTRERLVGLMMQG